MKGSALPWFGVVLLIILVSFAIIKILPSTDVQRNVLLKDSDLIAFSNSVHLFQRTLNESVDFISKRTAYDLGKTSGLDTVNIQFWTDLYPQLDLLKTVLENRIKNNLPNSNFVDMGIGVLYGGTLVNVKEVIPTGICGPPDASLCFVLDGEKNFTFNDTFSGIQDSVNHKISSNIESSYFRLLAIGRKIVEDPKYSSNFNDANKLKNILEADFHDFDFVTTIFGQACLGDVNSDNVVDATDATLIANTPNFGSCTIGQACYNPKADVNSDGIINILDVSYVAAHQGPCPVPVADNGVTITIIDKSCPPGYYCLAPLKPTETGITLLGKQIPYDYLSLSFNVSADQTFSSLLTFDFSLTIDPASDSIKSGESTQTFVKVKSLGGATKPVSLSYTLNPSEPTITVTFDPNSGDPTYSSLMTVKTTTDTPSGTYQITATGTGDSLTRSAVFTLTVNPIIDFSLDINPASGIVEQGKSVQTNINANFISGTAVPVTFSYVLTPDDSTISISLSQSSCTPTCSSIMTVQTLSLTPSGNYRIDVTAIGGGRIRTATYTLKVGPSFDFNIILNPNSGTLEAGKQTTSTVNINLLSGSAQPVSLSAKVVSTTDPNIVNPSGISVSFSPITCNPSCTSTMTITTQSTLPVDKYAIVVEGKDGGLSRTATYTLTVNLLPLLSDFTFIPSSPTVGQQVTFTGTGIGGSPPYTYSWDIFNDGTIDGTGQTFPYTFSSAGSFQVRLIVTDSIGQGVQTIKPVSVGSLFDFSISFNQNPVSVNAGSQTSNIVRVTLLSGTSQPVTLSAFSRTTTNPPIVDPPGISLLLNPTLCTPTCSSALTITTASTLTAGTYEIYVQGTAANIGKISKFDLIVNLLPLLSDFTFIPSSPTVGQQVTFTGTGIGGSPPYTYSWDIFNDGTIDGTGQTFPYTFSSAGSFQVRLIVTDSIGQGVQTIKPVSVGSLFDFSISFDKSSITINAGDQTVNTATIALLSGTSQPVSLSSFVEDSNNMVVTQGISVSLSQTSCNPTCPSTVTVTTQSTLPTGIYKVYVEGLAANIGKIEGFDLIVNPQTCNVGSMSVNPTSAATYAGGSTIVSVKFDWLCNNPVNAVSGFLIQARSQATGAIESSITATFNPISCDPPASGSSCSTTMTVRTSGSTPVGKYNIFVFGGDGGRSVSATYVLDVQPVGTLEYCKPGSSCATSYSHFKTSSVEGAQITVPKGTSVTVLVHVKAVGGYANGQLSVDVIKDICKQLDQFKTGWTVPVAIPSGVETFWNIGSFVADENTLSGDCPFISLGGEIRQYFIKVDYNGINIYDNTDWRTREWVRTS